MLYSIENEVLALTANTAGAELWDLRQKERPEIPLLWDGKADIWPRRAPVCFPWCGPLDEGWFEAEGIRCQAPQHGFIRDVEHCLEEQGTDFLIFRFDWPGDRERYPWAFSFTTRHALRGNEVLTTCRAVNRSDRPMAAQLGFHPGLRCPFTPGKSRQDYLIRFERSEAPDGSNIFPLEEHTFDHDSICFESLHSAWIQVEERESGAFLRIDTEGWPYVLLWSKPGIPGYVCIEPWTGYRGPGHDLSKRPGALLLQPGEALERTQRLTVGI